MRLRSVVFALFFAVSIAAPPAMADDHTEAARRAEEQRRADEARRAEAAHHAQDMPHPNAPPAVGDHHPGWSLHDLEAKERAKAKFTKDEKVELDRLRAERQKRRDELAESDLKREREREARRKESQRLAAVHYAALAHDAAAHEEFQRDAQLTAQLQRARDVAQAEGRDDALTRVETLIQREKDRHQAWLAAHGQG